MYKILYVDKIIECLLIIIMLIYDVKFDILVFNLIIYLIVSINIILVEFNKIINYSCVLFYCYDYSKVFNIFLRI